MRKKKYPLLPHLIFAVVYLLPFWFAEEAMVLVVIGIFSMFWLFPAATVVFLVWTIISVIKKTFTSRYRLFFVWYVTFITCFFVGIRVIAPLAQKQYEKYDYPYDRAVAGKVIQALERYKENTGTYPQTLDELVPEYLQEFPRRKSGGRFGYLSVQDSFYLKYPDKKAGQCYHLKGWEDCDFGL